MATPKFRKSASKRDMRRAHDALKPLGNSFCSNCGEVILPHTVCRDCGHYKGKEVMKPRKVGGWENADFDVEGAE